MTEATVALALTDYVPVALSTLALAWVAGIVGDRAPERRAALVAGVVLIGVGGLAKATGKLVLAVSGRDVVVLNEGLFPLLAPGMLVVALGVGAVLAGRSRPSPRALVGTVVALWAGAAALTAATSWVVTKPALIVVTSAANVALLVLLARASAREGSRAGAALFLASLVGVLALAGMSRALEPTIANQWLEQTANALVQGLLVVAVRTWQRALATARAAVLGAPAA